MRLGPWIAAVAALSGVVVLAHLVHPGGGLPLRLHGIMDVAHVLGFTGFTWLVADRATRLAEARGRPVAPVFAAAVLFAFVLAGLSEAAQTFVAREPSLDDLGRDAGGIAAGALFSLVARRRIRPAVVWAAAGCAVLAGVLWEPGRVVSAMTAARLRLPALVGFESGLEEVLYAGINAELLRMPAGPDWPLPGHVVEIRPVGGERYAGIGFLRLPSNWTGYTSLSFVIAANDADVRPFTIRIHDIRHDFRYEDRFNGTFEMAPAPQRVRIALDDIRRAPAGRALDLERIEQVVVFVDTTEAGGFRIDDLRLE